MSDSSTLFTLDSVRISYRDIPALDTVSWVLSSGSHHAVLGMNGSGKSTLLRLIAGDARPDQLCGGSIHWMIDGQREDSPIAIKGRYGFVSAELQEKYIRQAWRMTGEEIILSGFFASPMLYSTPTEAQREAAQDTARLLDAAQLLDMELPAMSQGQLRKILLARAVVHSPRVLLLDEICEGLDAANRDIILAAVDCIASPQTTVLLTGHRPEEFPSCITKGLLLHHGRLVKEGSLSDTLTELQKYQALALSPPRESVDSLTSSGVVPLPAADKKESALSAGQQDISAKTDRGQKDSKQAAGHKTFSTGAELPSYAADQLSETGTEANGAGNPIVSISHAQVFIERKQILHDITWQINSGENWVILGPNGAGKSTLLRLIYGDERQAWGGEVQWFGSSGPVSLQEVHRRITIVSDKLQATYGHDKYHATLLELSGEDLVLSGFFSSTGLWWHTVTDEQRTAAARWMHRLGISSQAHKPVRTMSYGTLRRFMLARAVVAKPQLLILDEPLSGMDERSRSQFIRLLSSLAQQKMQLVLVTHHQQDIIPEITHELHLHEGRITYCGPRRNNEIKQTG
ncbi:ABC transporter ATP-binding protein [Oleidesulfovibrio sp.]|uniref:ABC transporter ATP-binding protein n=1 Tax=Oleidesulfovibrio sp. TaxID=2909707 RepID=UPI003A84A204